MVTRKLRVAALLLLASTYVVWAWPTSAQQVGPQVEKPAAPAKKDAANDKTIRALILQLGDDSFDMREAAFNRLTAIGEAARGLLEKAAKDSTDFETRSPCA